MILIVIGVSGSGKTTVGQLLASRLQWEFVDADDHHPPANRLKMEKGIALTDEDRGPWLETLARLINDHRTKEQPLILACSALKNAYRIKLGVDDIGIRTIYLKGAKKELASRLAKRKHAFFDPALLDSQLAALEEPDSGLVLPIEASPQTMVNRIIQWLTES